jgi:hypothetical protein
MNISNTPNQTTINAMQEVRELVKGRKKEASPKMEEHAAEEEAKRVKAEEKARKRQAKADKKLAKQQKDKLRAQRKALTKGLKCALKNGPAAGVVQIANWLKIYTIDAEQDAASIPFEELQFYRNLRAVALDVLSA